MMYAATRSSPVIQLERPLMMRKLTMSTDMISVAVSKRRKSSERSKPMNQETSTQKGATNSAICVDDPIATLQKRTGANAKVDKSVGEGGG